ncbi:MAG: ATP-dependent helicase HrpA [Frankiales bacterium]|jgi:ATP-dependent helicase HrpA|nr:ATP-dependent helicase HrpA [Frankiales bacterium]
MMLDGRLAPLTVRDRTRLSRRLHQGQDVSAELAAAEERVARRHAAVPQRIVYPETLPVSERRDDIAAAIRDHQVVVIAGETGSGKTTQIPKICLELGRGVRGLIGHTQPRRLAARSVAERIAEELQTPLGSTVGYTVRFHDQVGDDTLVKLMTDGILLAEMQRDRDLLAYDTIIIDEAHERSLNIDFLLGLLKQLLARRPDLKLIITSATIDPQRFADHFGGAPVLEVSGRSYPVEVRYRPMVDEDVDQVQAIVEAVDELSGEGPGDILVFLSGEREIRDTADALRGSVPEGTEVLPLFARLSAAEQHRVFAPHPGRRVVLATNVAETSLTVPGIRYVVDPGTARISRYSQRTKVQRLPIEAISQASATQRAGRCGRVAPGICIRLYEEEDLLARPEFTDPEILRTNLASVILQMKALNLGDVTKFPFVEPPDRRNVKDGLDLLVELGALDASSDRLTKLGRSLAQLPIDPRLGRMVLEADQQGCVRDVLVIASALSIQDPRERPQEKQQAATELHNRFADETSDFLAYLNLWRYLQEQQKELSSSAFRRLCKKEYLNYLRVREWQDLHSQLRRALRTLDLSLDASPTNADAVHMALLAGLLSHVGLRDVEKREYVGARGARWAIVPSSALAKKAPRWVMAAELVETNRMWGRVAARIDPAWVERVGAHLVKRSYSEPHWERKQASVMAYERVTLYGIPVVAQRKVSFGRIAPVLCREMFIRSALVEGEWDTRHQFFDANRALLEDVEELEHRARRRDIVVDDQALYDFYDARIPAPVVSGAHFDAWWKTARHETPDLLTFTLGDLVSDEADVLSALDHPDVWVQGELRLPLTYQFEPGSDADGVTVHIPLAVLNRVTPDGFDWQVPGLRQDLVTALIKSLPKPLRVRCVPAPDTAAAFLSVVEPRSRPLLDALESELLNVKRVDIRAEDWDLSKVPPHLRMTFRVEDAAGKPLAEGKDLEALKAQLQPKVASALSAASPSVERTGLVTWDLGTLPREVVSGQVRGFPALVDEGKTVGVRVQATPAQQAAVHWRGTRKLLQLTLPPPSKAISGRMTNAQKLALTRSPVAPAAVFEDCTTCALDFLMASGGGPAWDAEGFARLRDHVRADLIPTVEQVLASVEKVLTASFAVTARVDASRRAHPESLVDIRAQLAALVGPGFATATGKARLPDLLRYLQALEVRLDKLEADPGRDRLNVTVVARVQAELDDLRRRVPPSPQLDELRWMVEELRISLFAQPMRTRYAVSEKRIYKAMDALLP